MNIWRCLMPTILPLSSFYHSDVVLELSGSEIRGAQGIKNFYADVKKYISERVEVTNFYP